MKSDSFTRTLLIIIVTLLALNILLPILSNPPISYAAKNIEYKVVKSSYVFPHDSNGINNLKLAEENLNEYGKEGWEYLDAILTTDITIFKR
jgi:hypothetical protein